jgi:hypothetical protein
VVTTGGAAADARPAPLLVDGVRVAHIQVGRRVIPVLVFLQVQANALPVSEPVEDALLRWIAPDRRASS